MRIGPSTPEQNVPPVRALPDEWGRDDPFLMANATFPDVERLARDGLPHLGSDQRADPNDSLDDGWTPPPGFDEAGVRCVQEELGEGDAIHPAQQLYADVSGAWSDVLADIEADDEIRGHAETFSGCLREEGVPADSATDEFQFLFHVDALVLEAAGDPAEQRAVQERYGRLYAECGRDLFLARERLRSGQRRTDFLAEHAAAIRELSDVLYGDGGWESP
jgi:hypothetical protein